MKFEKISVLLMRVFNLILSGFSQILSIFQLNPFKIYYINLELKKTKNLLINL
jgi:hypothetical protein